jgi:myo-inositol-1(or 4)-monophosphatase
LINELKKARPNFAVLLDNDKPADKTGCFVVCPVCGVQNYINGLPNVCISVAIVENNAVTCAVIYNPITDDMYFAEKGKGAYKEGFRSHERLRVSAKQELEGALVAIKPNGDVETTAKYVNNTIALCKDVRVSGATALDLAYVASGKLDAVIAPSSMLASIAAGVLLVRESGGLALDIDQTDTRTEDLPMVLNSGNLMAVSFNLSQKIAKILK